MYGNSEKKDKDHSERGLSLRPSDSRAIDDEFCLTASDEKGHSLPVSTRVAPSMAMQLDIILSSKQWPFRTKGDIVRTALIKYFKYLEVEKPIPGSMLGHILAVEEIVRWNEAQKQFLETISQAEALVKGLSYSDPDIARTVLLDIKEAIDKMPDGPWRFKFVREYEVRMRSIIDALFPKDSM